jgi:hypothetical protein
MVFAVQEEEADVERTAYTAAAGMSYEYLQK